MVQKCLCHVHTNTLQNEHACTCTWIYMNVWSMYIHVYECKVMYVHCTYTVTVTFMIVNMCMYIVQTRLRLYSSTATLHFSSGLDLCTPLPCMPVCTVHVRYMYYAIVQIWLSVCTAFRQVFTPLEGSEQVGSFPAAFSLLCVQTLLCTVYQCTDIDIRVLDMFLKKSYRKATHLPWPF